MGWTFWARAIWTQNSREKINVATIFFKFYSVETDRYRRLATGAVGRQLVLLPSLADFPHLDFDD